MWFIVYGNGRKPFISSMDDGINCPLKKSHGVTQAAVAWTWHEFWYTEQVQHPYAADGAEISIGTARLDLNAVAA